MIILEGPDAAGKSTLAEVIATRLQLEIKQGDGPPKGPGEIIERCVRYAEFDNVIFDRHPIISEPIYSKLRAIDPPNVIPHWMIEAFYKRQPMLIIFCDGVRGLSSHVVKEGESPEHIEALRQRYNDILQSYRRWAQKHAHVYYRIGDDMQAIVAMCEGYHAYRMAGR